jgi:5-formyltetrahydrofolate cyclo-ligase
MQIARVSITEGSDKFWNQEKPITNQTKETYCSIWMKKLYVLHLFSDEFSLQFCSCLDSNTQKKLYVPWVEDKNSNMRMLHISHMEDLVANSMNILEPAPVDAQGNDREDVLQADEPIDLFILPGLAFDRCGRRLGRGGGYVSIDLKFSFHHGLT